LFARRWRERTRVGLSAACRTPVWELVLETGTAGPPQSYAIRAAGRTLTIRGVDGHGVLYGVWKSASGRVTLPRQRCRTVSPLTTYAFTRRIRTMGCELSYDKRNASAAALPCGRRASGIHCRSQSFGKRRRIGQDALRSASRVYLQATSGLRIRAGSISGLGCFSIPGMTGRVTLSPDGIRQMTVPMLCTNTQDCFIPYPFPTLWF
jgi:hypothetical protein